MNALVVYYFILYSARHIIQTVQKAAIPLIWIQGLELVALIPFCLF